MRYVFRCYDHDPFEVEAPIAEGPPSIVYCPVCNEEAMRIWASTPVRWDTQGAHNTDYDQHGDKLERFNNNWSKKYNEKPPPPAKDVPKNSKDPY
jgi:hypothetical protein